MNHNAGDLNIRAFIENPSTVGSDSGGHTEQYTIVGEIWIGIAAEGGGESEVANRQVATGDFLVSFRRVSVPMTANTTRFRLKETDRVLNLIENPRELVMRGGDFVVRCTEGDQEED